VRTPPAGYAKLKKFNLYMCGLTLRTGAIKNISKQYNKHLPGHTTLTKIKTTAGEENA
jgi:hypothetical protein